MDIKKIYRTQNVNYRIKTTKLKQERTVKGIEMQKQKLQYEIKVPNLHVRSTKSYTL